MALPSSPSDERTSSGQYAQCRNERNPHHKCNDNCLARIYREAELYGPAGGHSGTQTGRWSPQIVTRLANAEPVGRTLPSTSQMMQHLSCSASSPVIVTSAQTGWKAADLWNFDFFREAFGADVVLCSDKVPSRRNDTPPGQSLRVPLRDACDYCTEAEAPALTRAETQGSAFQITGWPAFSDHAALESHVDLRSVIPDATPEDTPQRRELSKAMSRIIFAPPSAMTRLHTPEKGTHLCVAQIRGRRQVVLYAPSSTEAVYGHRSLQGQSDFNPFRPNFDSFPLARSVCPRTAVLEAGEILIIPAGWWFSDVCLEPSIAVARNFVTEGPTLAAFTAALLAAERASPTSAPASGAPPSSSPLTAAAARTVAPGTAAGPSALLRAAAPATSVAGVELAPLLEVVDPLDDPSADIYERATRHRVLGNDFFKSGRVREATEAYTKAIELLELEEEAPPEELDSTEPERGDLAVCLSNRAACWLRRKQWRQALADCNRVIRSGRMDGIVVKAYFRRGKAHEGLGDADSALADFRRVAELQPYNKEAAEELESYNSILHRLTVMSFADAETRRRQTGSG